MFCTMVEERKIEIKDYQKLELWNKSHSVSKLGLSYCLVYEIQTPSSY